MRIPPEILSSQEEFKTIRRTIHAHPELGYDVERTGDLVAECLTAWGIFVTRGVGKSGIVGTLRRGSSNRSIGLRADMDALPIFEENTFSHCSKNAGVMHACGHDGHTTMLLAAAKYLAKYGDFDGVIHFIFQPAEEGGAGARTMVEDGLFERFPCDGIFGVHNWPGLPEGHIGTRSGALMAGSAVFRINVKGVGSHAAMPQKSADAILAASHIVVALQSVISRNTDPLDSAVLSVTKLSAGTANNVIAKEALLTGAVRAFSDDHMREVEKRARSVSASVAEGLGCKTEFEWLPIYPATVNASEMTRLSLEAAISVVGTERALNGIRPTMASEDFSFMLKMRPGCYAFIGNGDGSHREAGSGGGPCELHNNSYDFNDRIIPVGAAYFSALVRDFLG